MRTAQSTLHAGGLQFSLCLCLFHQRGKILVMPVRRGLCTINIVEETARDFLLLQVFLNAEIASLIMIDRMAGTPGIRAGAVLFCALHRVGSFPLGMYIPGGRYYIIFQMSVE